MAMTPENLARIKQRLAREVAAGTKMFSLTVQDAAALIAAVEEGRKDAV